MVEGVETIHFGCLSDEVVVESFKSSNDGLRYDVVAQAVLASRSGTSCTSWDVVKISSRIS